MYAPPRPVPVAAAPARATALGPLLGICCLLIIGFLIAATIVLALIPVYLPREGQPSSQNNAAYPFLGTTPSDLGNDGNIPAGSLGSFNSPIDSAVSASPGTTSTQQGAIATGAQSKRKRGVLDLIRSRRGQTEQGLQQGYFLIIFLLLICRAKCLPLSKFLDRIASFSFTNTFFYSGLNRVTSWFFKRISAFPSSFNFKGPRNTLSSSTSTSTSSSTSTSTTSTSSTTSTTAVTTVSGNFG
jgi:hypothetical protein